MSDWRITEFNKPLNGQIVIVRGGVAQYRNRIFYTGMECPQFARPIQWTVTHWMPLPQPPAESPARTSKEKE